jgi:hypothetical protein
MQIQLLATQNEDATLKTEIERLRSNAGRLEQSVAQANEAAARAAESAQAFAAWRNKIRGLVTAADYRWPDDSPFVRIPKSVLPELSKVSQAQPFSPPGVVLPYARELMGMTPSERQSVEETLQRHFADVEGRVEAGIYETNSPRRGRFPSGAVAATAFVVALGDEAKHPADQTLRELRGILGEERWPLVQVKLDDPFSRTLAKILNPSPSGQELVVSVAADAKGTLTVSCQSECGGLAGITAGALSEFLPEGDPNRTEGSQDVGGGCSEALRQRALTWLQNQATARLGKGASR